MGRMNLAHFLLLIAWPFLFMALVPYSSGALVGMFVGWGFICLSVQLTGKETS